MSRIPNVMNAVCSQLTVCVPDGYVLSQTEYRTLGGSQSRRHQNNPLGGLGPPGAVHEAAVTDGLTSPVASHAATIALLTPGDCIEMTG